MKINDLAVIGTDSENKEGTKVFINEGDAWCVPSILQTTTGALNSFFVVVAKYPDV
jgi:hypothetical protein